MHQFLNYIYNSLHKSEKKEKIFHLIPICTNGISEPKTSICTLFVVFLHHPSYVTIHLTLLFSQESLNISNHFINGRGRQGYRD